MNAITNFLTAGGWRRKFWVQNVGLVLMVLGVMLTTTLGVSDSVFLVMEAFGFTVLVIGLAMPRKANKT